MARSLHPAVGETPTRIITIDAQAPYPKIYVATPKRWLATAGFGVFQKDELIVHVSGTKNIAGPDIRLGELITAEGRRTLTATFTSYKDRSIEGGLRHYFKAVGDSKSYVNLLFGRRKIEAISMTLVATGNDGNLGTVRVYDGATLPTAAIVFGVTYEKGFAGVFIEGGARWTQRLPRQDDDLRALGPGLEPANNTGSRVFMPANIGILLRF